MHRSVRASLLGLLGSARTRMDLQTCVCPCVYACACVCIVAFERHCWGCWDQPGLEWTCKRVYVLVCMHVLVCAS
jgi:hypothetical protein